MGTNNKLREALSDATELLESILEAFSKGEGGVYMSDVAEAIDNARAALAAPATAENSSAVGNAAKLREALVVIKALTDSYADDLSLLGTVYRTANAFLKEVGDGNSQKKEGGNDGNEK